MQLEYPPRLGWCTKHNSTTICKDCEIESLTARLAERDAEIDQLRVQLAGCGVAAMCNTRESMQQQLCCKGDYGYSASYQDVIDAVSREIALRDENATLRQEVERLKEGKANRAAREHAEAHQLGIEKGRKQTAAEILDSLTQEEIRRITSVGDPRVTTISSKLLAMMAELRQRYGLEG